MTKEKQLRRLKTQMQNDKSLPLRDTATNLVFGEGNPEAKVYFLGEAPGHSEDLKGKPFAGQAGKLFDNLLHKIGLTREDIFISNSVSFRPPNNRDPKPNELAAFAPYIEKQIKIIDPKIIVTLGRFALAKFLPGHKISEVHGRHREIIWHGKKITLIPIYHPAAGLRKTEVKQKLIEDFKTITKILKSS